MDEEQQLGLISEAPVIKRSPTSQASSPSSSLQSPIMPRKISIRVDNNNAENDGCHLTIPKVIAVSSSSETLTGIFTEYACSQSCRILIKCKELMLNYLNLY